MGKGTVCKHAVQAAYCNWCRDEKIAALEAERDGLAREIWFATGMMGLHGSGSQEALNALIRLSKVANRYPEQSPAALARAREEKGEAK